MPETILPMIPDVPADMTARQRPFVSSIKEIIEVRERRRGDPLDGFVSFRDLREAISSDETIISYLTAYHGHAASHISAGTFGSWYSSTPGLYIFPQNVGIGMTGTAVNPLYGLAISRTLDCSVVDPWFYPIEIFDVLTGTLSAPAELQGILFYITTEALDLNGHTLEFVGIQILYPPTVATLYNNGIIVTINNSEPVVMNEAVMYDATLFNLDASGTITTGIIYQATFTASGTIGDAFLFKGAYTEAFEGPAVFTNKWGIYLDGEDKNYLSGKLGIGTPTITRRLHLGGDTVTSLQINSSAWPSGFPTVLGVDSSAAGFLQFGNNAVNYMFIGSGTAGGWLSVYASCTGVYPSAPGGVAVASFGDGGYNQLIGPSGVGIQRAVRLLASYDGSGGGPALDFCATPAGYINWVQGRIAVNQVLGSGNWGGEMSFWTNSGAGETDYHEWMRITKLGGIGIGTGTVPHASIGTAQLAIDGTTPYVQFTNSGIGNYPLFSIYPLSSNGSYLIWNAYLDGATWRYSTDDWGSAFRLAHYQAMLQFEVAYRTPGAPGDAIAAWYPAFTISNAWTPSLAVIGINVASPPLIWPTQGGCVLEIHGTQSARPPAAWFSSNDDNHPNLMLMGYAHDNIIIGFDTYWWTTYYSGDPGSNYAIQKTSDQLRFLYASGNTAGNTFSFSTAAYFNTSGIFTFNQSPVIGVGAAGVDYTLTFDGEDNDGTITWDEDGPKFKFSHDVLILSGSNTNIELAASDGFISVGRNDAMEGYLKAFGSASGAQGGTLQLYTGADHDASFEYFIIQAYEDDLLFGLSTDTDALKLDANKDLYLTDGDVYVQAAGTTRVKLDNNGIVYLGVDDTTKGGLVIYGSASKFGADIYLYVPLASAGTIESYRFQVYYDELWIGPNIDQDALRLDENKDFYVTDGDVYVQNAGATRIILEASSARLKVGADDTEDGYLLLYGDTTGSSQGGAISMFTAADYDTSIDSYAIQAYEDDLWIGPAGDQDALTLNSNKNLVLTDGDFYVQVAGVTTVLLDATNSAVVVGDIDTTHGEIYARGNGAASTQGGFLRLETAADHDGTINGFDFQAYEDDLYIGPNTDTDALKLTSDKDLYLTAGDAYIYGRTANALTIGNGAAGVDYTITFNGETNDGVITWMEDEDTFTMACNFGLEAGSYFNFGATYGTSGYGIRDNAGAIEYKDSGGSWIALNSLGGGAPANPLTIGTDDTTVGSLYLYGGGAGADGGVIRLYLGADDDATIDYFLAQIVEDDFVLGPNTDPDALKLNNLKDLYLTDGDIYVQLAGSTKIWMDATNSAIGVGVTSLTWCTANLSRTAAVGSSDASIQSAISSTGTSSSTVVHRNIYLDSNINQAKSGYTYTVRNFELDCDYQASANVSYGYAFYCDSNVAGTAVVGDLVGLRLTDSVNSGGAVTTYRGIDIGITVSASGGVGTGYILQGSLSTNITTRWGLYLSNEVQNYLSGNLLIGTTSSLTSLAGGLVIGNGTAASAVLANAVGLWCADINGAAGQAGLHMMAESEAVALVVVGVQIKGTTGDPTGHEGKMCINTTDNNVKIYADGAWRQLATW